MTVIAEYTLPGEDFGLGRAATAGAELELERLVVDGGTSVGYFWVRGSDDGFEESLRESASLESVSVVDEVGGGCLYRGVWPPEDGSLVEALVRFDTEVLDAKGDHEQWWFRVGFEDRDVLSDFQSYCVDAVDASLELDRLYNPIESAPQVDSDLTPRQRETLVTAHGKGYYDIPREITLVDLAEELDVSDQAVSERLRRGESKLIRNHLLEE